MLSDFLRIIILYLEGGLYIDYDNKFRTQMLKQKTAREVSRYKMMLNLPQGIFEAKMRSNGSVHECYEYEMENQNYIFTRQHGFELPYTSPSCVYSLEQQFGNSVIYARKHAAGCCELLREMINAYERQHTSDSFSKGAKQVAAMLQGRMKKLFSGLSIPGANSDYDWRRYGFVKASKEELIRSGEISEKLYDLISPKYRLTTDIGPNTLLRFETYYKNLNLSLTQMAFDKIKTSFINNIVCESDQSWI